MALIKQETLPNGVPITYWRIVSITSIVNNQSIIELAGYVNEKARQDEQKSIANPDDGCDVYVHTVYMPIEYDPALSIDSAYKYVKGLDGFKGSKDA